DDRALGEFKADGDRSPAEAFTESACPGVDDRRAVFEHRSLESGGAWNVQADVMLAVSPVDSDEGGELGRFFLHESLLDLGSGRDMQRRAQRMQYGEPVKAAFPEGSLRAKGTPAGAKPS